jgi:hypothetical protein
MKKEKTMRYLRGELLLIGFLSTLLIIAMVALYMLDSADGTVGNWASSFYYHLVRL